MKVTKNNKLFMIGTRNQRDNLYDIPIAKTSLQRDNFIHSITHPALYGINNARATFLQPNKQHMKRHIPCNIDCDLQNMACLAEHNALDQSLAEYKKIDDR